MKKPTVLLLVMFFLGTMAINHCCDEHKKYVLITVLYNEKNPERIHEYLTCLQLNLTNEAITKIHVLYDTSADDNTNEILNYILHVPNITLTFIPQRATYQYCFELANRLYPLQNIILSNADIYFNDTLQELDLFDLKGKFIALTRWTVNSDNTVEVYNGKKKLSESQDVWIFKTPLKRFKANFPLGVPGCDNAISYQAKKAKLMVINPCFTIQSFHLHQSKIRNRSTETVPPPYASLPLCSIQTFDT